MNTLKSILSNPFLLGMQGFAAAAFLILANQQPLEPLAPTAPAAISATVDGSTVRS